MSELSKAVVDKSTGKSRKNLKKKINYVSCCNEKENFEKDLQTVFDIIKVDRDWLCKEDQELCEMQIESQGLGYTTSIVAFKSYIHPPKRRKTCTQVPYSTTGKFHIFHK